jgi:thiol-disulfide isomerase/thioredoxin
MRSVGSRAAGACLAGAIVLAAFASSPCPLAADGPLPVRLVDPVKGGEVALSPGDAALHVVFFATWCEPCLAQMTRLAEIEDRYKGSGYRLVLVAVPTRQTAERLARFAAEARPPGELLFDATGEARKAFSLTEIPEHVLLDATGRIVARGSGPEAIGDVAIRRALESRSPGAEVRP